MKSLRELDLFNVMRRILRGDPIAPLSDKGDKNKHGSDMGEQGAGTANYICLLTGSSWIVRKTFSVGRQCNSGICH